MKAAGGVGSDKTLGLAAAAALAGLEERLIEPPKFAPLPVMADTPGMLLGLTLVMLIEPGELMSQPLVCEY